MPAPTPEKDEVTDYLETVLKGLVKDPTKVDVLKKEFPKTEVIHYKFDVAKEDRPFFTKIAVRDALEVIADRATWILYTDERRNWDTSLKRWDEPW